jgi:transposase-like protein
MLRGRPPGFPSGIIESTNAHCASVKSVAYVLILVPKIWSESLHTRLVTARTFQTASELKADGVLEENCLHRPVQYLNNVLEQDHRAIKRRIRASQHFRSFWGAWHTIAGYEAIHMIRKGQACWSAARAKVCLLHRFILGLFAAT